MKNERIITHFLSYTTAQGCVKDLTSDFAGRISFASANNHSLQPSSREKDRFDEAEWVDDVTEMGGIALGTFAYLMPGFSPVLPGGPAGGAVIGDVLGDYLETRIRSNRNEQQPDVAQDGPFLVGVDVSSEAEAVKVETIIRQHGGTPHRTDGNVPFTAGTARKTESAEMSAKQWDKKE